MSEISYATPIKRGCGSRKKGGAYWETAMSEHGQPIEHFLRCPPPVIDPVALGLGVQGITLIESEETYWALDWIGSMDYPNVTDFLEEGRRFGISRRFELSKEQYQLITPDSKLICAHAAGHITDTEPYHTSRIGMQDEFFGSRYKWEYCPCGVQEHEMSRDAIFAARFNSTDRRFPDFMCCGLWWEDVVLGDPVPEEHSRLVIRTMPSFRYRAVRPDVKERLLLKTHLPAIIGVFPLGRIAVVEDPDEGKHEAKIKTLEEVGLPFGLVKE